ncbi:Dabb family protein [Sulfoacidibacillus thermotolerans]|uniref:Stress-response A/B barrel domain-containing protein n=1 Tax=Sulfoacidibacillus thermotolerans TaxID=1765684 RepID=A0A2U3DA06_SULT2|nr:Dabb family protein [Sulfoacidibacillus thermotolerans]PWI58106.1 hypothetical protein BM613_05430 [Sulfoacidibacillus thermotolerans]
MVEHVVLIKWKADVSEAEKQHLLESLKALRDQIEGIQELRVGHNFSARSLGYDAGLVVTFADVESLSSYGPHPLHQKVAVRLNQAADLLALDFHPL